MNNTLILNGEKYRLIEVLGEGSYGIVYKARRESNGKIYAIKMIKPGKKFEDKLDEEFLTEKVILQVLKEKTGSCKKGFVCYENAFKEFNSRGEADYIFITEFIEGMSLYDFIDQDLMGKFQAKQIFKNIIKAYKKLRRRGVIHRDIKAENMMINPNTLEITFIDFGLSCLGSPSIHRGLINSNQVKDKTGRTKTLEPSDFECKGMLGSPVYLAPEVIKYQYATEQSDIYSLGITFLFILTKDDVILKGVHSGALEYLLAVRDDAYNPLFNERGKERESIEYLISSVERIDVFQMAQLLESMTNINSNLRPKIDDIMKRIDNCFTY